MHENFTRIGDIESSYCERICVYPYHNMITKKHAVINYDCFNINILSYLQAQISYLCTIQIYHE